MDMLLIPYFQAGEHPVEQQCLAALIEEHAQPIIRRVVSRKLAGLWDDVEDVCAEAQLELLLHLRRIKSAPDSSGILDFPAYVATVAASTCNSYFRRRRPGRARLKKQIAYLMREDSTFQMILSPDGRSWCASRLQRGASRISDPAIIDQLARDSEGDRNLVTAMERIFENAGGQIELETLVEIVARVWHIPPDPAQLLTAVDMDAIAAPWREEESAIDERRFAARLWDEIRQLPRRQRVALLLNLRDGRGNSVLAIFPLTGIARFGDVAGVLELSETELADAWPGLPFDDNRIAGMLGCARQQVINLRMAAKKRLSVRMRGLMIRES
jgi:DNA-directed RNA polymerase specialized sigma24 family protein